MVTAVQFSNNCLPAIAIEGDGFLIGKNTTLETTLPGLTTVTDAVPAFATSAALIVAFSLLWESTEVARGDPFQLSTALVAKSVPFTIKLNPLLPGLTLAGTNC
jgi:hypothetical protein